MLKQKKGKQPLQKFYQKGFDINLLKQVMLEFKEIWLKLMI